MDKTINIVISGICAIIALVAVLFFIGFIQFMITKFLVVKLIWLSMSTIVALAGLMMLWIGIYDYIRERQDIKEYINKDE